MDQLSRGQSPAEAAGAAVAAAVAGIESSSRPALTDGDDTLSGAVKEESSSASTALDSNINSTSTSEEGVAVPPGTAVEASSSLLSPWPAGAQNTSTPATTTNTSSTSTTDFGEIPPANGVPAVTENGTKSAVPPAPVLPGRPSRRSVVSTSEMPVVEDQNGDAGGRGGREGPREATGMGVVNATRSRSSKRQGGRSGSASSGNKKNWRPVRVSVLRFSNGCVESCIGVSYIEGHGLLCSILELQVV